MTNEPKHNTENLTVGTEVTIHIGSDRYAAKIVKSTARTCVAEYTAGGMKGKQLTFRLTTRDAFYYTSGRSHYLRLDGAHHVMNPSF